jgi:hypothetical protein
MIAMSGVFTIPGMRSKSVSSIANMAVAFFDVVSKMVRYLMGEFGKI